MTTDRHKIELLRDALKQFQYAAHEMLPQQGDKMRLAVKMADSALATTTPDAISVEQGEGQEPVGYGQLGMEGGKIFIRSINEDYHTKWHPTELWRHALYTRPASSTQTPFDARKRLEKMYEQGSKTIAAQSEKEMHEKFRKSFEAHYKELGKIIAAMRAIEAGQGENQ